MTPEQLHRAVLTATACLAHRLGTHAGQGENTGPVAAGSAKTRARTELGALMAELRSAGPEHGPPANLLELEGAIRGLRGERHHMAEIGGDRLRTDYRFLIRYLTDTEPDIQDDFDTVIRQAREHIMRRLTS